MKQLPFFIYIFVIAVSISHAVYYFLIMPDPMASHFGFGGKADNWASKQSFFIIWVLILLFNIGIFILLPWGLQKFRVKAINVPNGDYWLTPERIDEVYVYFREKMCWFGIVKALFMIIVFHLAFKANLRADQSLYSKTLLIALAGYLVFVIIWLITFYRKFRRTD